MLKLILSLAFIAGLAFKVSSQPDQNSYHAFSRLDYYTGEETGAIIVYVPDEHREKSIKIDLVFEFQFVNTRFPVIPGGISTVPFSLKLLREGDNEMTVSFYENDKWVDSRKVNVKIRSDKMNEVKIDRASGCLMADGLPFFPVGFSAAWPFDMQQLDADAGEGFNLVSPAWRIDKKGRKERMRLMDRCAALGIKVNYNLSDITVQNPGDIKKFLQQEIELMKNHPSLLSWQIAGELTDSLELIYHLIKETDPYHPVSMVFPSPQHALMQRNMADVIIIESKFNVLNNDEGSYNYLAALQDFLLMGKPVWITADLFGDKNNFSSELTPREARVLTYLNILHHVSGILYRTGDDNNYLPKSLATRSECGAMALELIELMPSLFSGQAAPWVSHQHQDIYSRVLNLNGMFTVMVVNFSDQPGEIFLTLPEVDFTTDVEVMFENRTVNMAGGVIRDMADAMATRFYRIDGRMKIDRMKDLRPGNLTVDPGFEDVSLPGKPANCLVTRGKDPGASFFLDGRVHREGDHSLRLTTPEEGKGVRLLFFTREIDPSKDYTVAVWGGRGLKGTAGENEDMTFILSLGNDNSRQFTLTEEWKEYSFSIPGSRLKASSGGNIMPSLELIGKGTAWFDLIQVFPF